VTFQMRAVVSSDPVTTRLPSALNIAAYTTPSWPLKTAMYLPLFESQMRAVLSQDAVTTRSPSALNAAVVTLSVWPFRTAIRPLLGVVGDELGEVGGRARQRRASEVSQLRLDFGI